MVPRPTSISNDQILDAARETFLSEGLAACTADIARRAGVSEGLLFKRFGTKEQLFFSAMGCQQPRWVTHLETLDASGDVRENLTQLMLMIIEFFRDVAPRLMMVWSSRLLPPAGVAPAPDLPPLRALKALSSYLDREMAQGRLGNCDPEIVARMLLGASFNYAFLDLLGVHLRMPMPLKSYVRAVVDVIWRGIEPVAAARPRRKGRTRK